MRQPLNNFIRFRHHWPGCFFPPSVCPQLGPKPPETEQGSPLVPEDQKQKHSQNEKKGKKQNEYSCLCSQWETMRSGFTFTNSAWARKGNFLSALPLKPLLFLQMQKDEPWAAGCQHAHADTDTHTHAHMLQAALLTERCSAGTGCVQTPRS